MTPADSRRVAALESQIAALTRQLGNARGLGVNTAFGATHYRTTQIGFEVELTTEYDAATGYGWKRKRLVPGAAEPFTDPGVQPVGDKAFSFVDNRGLMPGVIGWLEPSPDAHGWVFIHGADTGSGSGADGGADGGSGSGGGTGDLETVYFDVVTAVDLDACTVTTKRVTLTGSGLSVVLSDPPSGGG